MGKFNTHCSHFFSDVKESATYVISKSSHLSSSQAEQIANELAYKLSMQWGGSMIYVAKHNPWQAHERDLQIWGEFTGNNHHELALKFGLSLPYIYEIIARMRKIYRKEQQDLFEVER